MHGRWRLGWGLVTAAAVVSGPAGIADAKCTAANVAELRDVLVASNCKSVKAKDFVLTVDAVNSIFFRSRAMSSSPASGGLAADTLVLSGTRLEPGAISRLGEAIRGGELVVHSLIFWNNGLDQREDESSEALAALVQTLQEGVPLRELRFADNLLYDEGAVELAEAVADSGVEELVLSGNGIGPAGVKRIGEALARSTAIRALTITGAERGANSWMSNDAGLEGGKGLAELLRRSRTLQKLVLSGANLQDGGVSALADGLVSPAALQILDLNRNGIGDIGAAALASAIAKTISLRIVVLSTNRITDEGAGALATAARGHAALTALDVENNIRMTPAGRAAVAAAVADEVIHASTTAVHTEL